jgi:GH25 family lysozyme M1 (1,4-beta-N-acetylmuramidase)
MKTFIKNRMMSAIATALALIVCCERARARPQGIDVSSFQGNVNWTAAYNNSSIRFGFAKATEGQYYQDAYYHNNMSNGKLAGCLMGAYDFARPDLDNPVNEANYFYNFAAVNFNIGGQTLGPVIDMEVWNGHVGASSYTDWANQWGNRILTRMHNDSRTCNWILYTSSCSACNFNSNVTGSPWIANYNGQSSETGTPWSSCSSCSWSGGNWRFWQWTATGGVSGVPGNCDRDVYNGLLSDLQASNLIMHQYP